MDQSPPTERQSDREQVFVKARWVKGLSAGVEFDSPLDPDDLEELLSEHRQSSSKVSRLPLRERKGS